MNELCFHSLRLGNGGEYLFQAKDDDELGQWVSSINQNTGEGGAAGGAAKSQTMPAGQQEKGKEKKGGFFTLKGKK